MLFIAQGSYTDIQLQFLGFLTSKIGVLGRQNEELRGLEFCNLLLWALHLDLEGILHRSCNTGDLDLIPRSGRSPGNGNPLQYSCLENPMDRGTWQATVHGSQESDTT